MYKSNHKRPIPLFDKLDNLNSSQPSHVLNKFNDDYIYSKTFLNMYKGSIGTFNSYRREIERFLHWSWIVKNISIKDINNKDIENYIEFCKKPPKSWISNIKHPKFIIKDKTRVPNIKWKPFVLEADKKTFCLSEGSVKEIFAILSSFYNYLIEDNYCYCNPVKLIRQKSKYFTRNYSFNKIRKLSDLQWEYVIDAANKMANINPKMHERTLFIVSILYSLYLRISELTKNNYHTPTMNDFYKDEDSNWWFRTIGKGNKERNIAVSDSMLKALKRWRMYLNLSPMPSPADKLPLIVKVTGDGPIRSTNQIRLIVDECFKVAANNLYNDKFYDESSMLKDATVHWLRHTGISNDIKLRPREHVRDDAGHSSSSITDKYINITLRERHESAKNKKIEE